MSLDISEQSSLLDRNHRVNNQIKYACVINTLSGVNSSSVFGSFSYRRHDPVELFFRPFFVEGGRSEGHEPADLRVASSLWVSLNGGLPIH